MKPKFVLLIILLFTGSIILSYSAEPGKSYYLLKPEELVDKNYWEKLFVEECRFENINGPAIEISNEGNANTQVNIRNLFCKNVPVLVNYPKLNTQTKAPENLYRVKRFVYGLQMLHRVFMLQIQAQGDVFMPCR